MTHRPQSGWMSLTWSGRLRDHPSDLVLPQSHPAAYFLFNTACHILYVQPFLTETHKSDPTSGLRTTSLTHTLTPAALRVLPAASLSGSKQSIGMQERRLWGLRRSGRCQKYKLQNLTLAPKKYARIRYSNTTVNKSSPPPWGIKLNSIKRSVWSDWQHKRSWTQPATHALNYALPVRAHAGSIQ